MLVLLKVFSLAVLLLGPVLGQNNTGTGFDRSNSTIANATAFAFPGQNLTTITIEYQPPSDFVNNSGYSYNISYPTVRRRVSYFVQQNLAIIDGDVIFGTESELLAHRVPDNGNVTVITRRDKNSPALQRRALSLSRESNQKWPNGRIEYYWESQTTKNARLNDWLEATKIWTDRLPFLSFVDMNQFKTLSTVNGPVVLKFDKGSVSSSPIGRATSAQGNVIVLGDIGTGPGKDIGVYVHEIGHSESITLLYILAAP
jgi:hypothetical protein